jgi:hypothetical protein
MVESLAGGRGRQFGCCLFLLKIFFQKLRKVVADLTLDKRDGVCAKRAAAEYLIEYHRTKPALANHYRTRSNVTESYHHTIIVQFYI